MGKTKHQNKSLKSKINKFFFIFSPEGKKFRSRFELQTYFKQIESDLDANMFDFTLAGKGNSPMTKSFTQTLSQRRSKVIKRKPLAKEKPKKLYNRNKANVSSQKKWKNVSPSCGKLFVKMNFSMPKRRKRSLSGIEATENIAQNINMETSY